MITLETLRVICNAFPDVTEDIKWGQDLCFCVREKEWWQHITTSYELVKAKLPKKKK